MKSQLKLKTPFNHHCRKDDTAFLIIDVQAEFFSPDRPGNAKSGHNVARKISSFVPMVRKLGLPVYAVYFNNPDDLLKRDFYKFMPDATDNMVYKIGMSAMDTGQVMTEDGLRDLEETLKERGIRNLVLCGGYTSACVSATVKDALEMKFNVIMIENLLSDFKGADTLYTKETLTEMGVQFMHARTFYREARKITQRP